MKPYRDKYRARLTRYTKRALLLLPEINHPKILDIGCGTGVPSIELARLTNGNIIGIDTDEKALMKMQKKVDKAGLANQINTRLMSLGNITFEDESFDILWAEGSITFIGFEKGLKDWKRLIKPSGYMVIHDELGDIQKKMKAIKSAGYKLIDYFELNETIWWDDYFEPLSKQLNAYLDGGLPLEGEALEVFKEIEMYHQSPKQNQSIYFIMQK